MFDSETDRQVLLIKKLHKYNIDVAIHYLANGQYKVVATKNIGINLTKHAEIIGIDIIDILEKVIQYIEDEIEQWLDGITYGQ